MSAVIIDDKSEHCIPFVLSRLEEHRQQHRNTGPHVPTFFLGLNGVQGAGKTTLVQKLCKTLSNSPHNVVTAVLSIDDLYLPHKLQQSLAQAHPDNPLVQHRGQPSTHDVELGVELFSAIGRRAPHIKIPSYDKSAHQGQGDRAPEASWPTINDGGPDGAVQLVIFEGWCVGFQALGDEQLRRKWQEAVEEAAKPSYCGQLGRLRIDDVRFVNDALRDYDRLTGDAEDTQYVYKWRQEQEEALRASRGAGMTDEQVKRFVDGYYPAYELYNEALRTGVLAGSGRQLRLVLGHDRSVKNALLI